MQARCQEKRTPTNHPHSIGGGLLKKEVCEMKQITNAKGLYCKPDANKKKAPIDTSLTKADEGGPGG